MLHFTIHATVINTKWIVLIKDKAIIKDTLAELKAFCIEKKYLKKGDAYSVTDTRGIRPEAFCHQVLFHER